MRLEDLVLVSVDDHVVEPPDLFDGRLSAEYAERAPKLDPQGQSASTCGRSKAPELPNIGLNAVAGRPPEEYAMDPQSFDDMRTGCYDIHDRVKDMNANGVLGSMCFPSFPQFCGQLFTRTAQHDATFADALVHAYNDWHIESWCGAYPGPVHPAVDPDDVGPREDGRRSAPRRREGLPRGDVLGEPGAPRPPVDPLGLLGPVLRGCRGMRHRRVRAHRLVVEDGDHRARRADGRADHALADQHRAGRGRLRVVEGAAEVPAPEVRAQRGRHRLDPVLPRAHRLHVRPPPLLDRAGHGRPPAEPGVRRAGDLLLDRRPGRRRDAAQDERRHDHVGVRLPALGLDVAAVARAVLEADAGRARLRRGHREDLARERDAAVQLRPVLDARRTRELHGRRAARAGRGLGREHRGPRASRRPGPARWTCSRWRRVGTSRPARVHGRPRRTTRVRREQRARRSRVERPIVRRRC